MQANNIDTESKIETDPEKSTPKRIYLAAPGNRENLKRAFEKYTDQG